MKKKPNGKQLGGIVAALLAVICAVCGIRLGQDNATTAAPPAATARHTQAQAQTERETAAPDAVQTTAPVSNLRFANEKTLRQHYEKHGIEMGFASPEEYLAAANAVVANPNALHKLEAEDNDHVYYLESTNEIVFVSQKGVIRTYFCPNSGKAYFDRQ